MHANLTSSLSDLSDMHSDLQANVKENAKKLGNILFTLSINYSIKEEVKKWSLPCFYQIFHYGKECQCSVQEFLK